MEEEEEEELVGDVRELFVYYNRIYFGNALGSVVVNWSSKRMTLCAGICSFSVEKGCEIRLSEPILKFRSVRDMKDTLLHEMIHAYFFLKNFGNAVNGADGGRMLQMERDGHGPRFLQKAEEINRNVKKVHDLFRPKGGYRITVFHNFTDEVRYYRKHKWRCNKCGRMVERAMNRPPSFKDCREVCPTEIK